MDATLLHNVKGKSLAEPVGPNGDTPLSEMLVDDTATSGEEGLLKNEATTLVIEALKELDPQEREVLEYRFGLHERRALVLREVGKIMGVSRERVRQIEVKATRRLRRMLLRRMSAPSEPTGQKGSASRRRMVDRSVHTETAPQVTQPILSRVRHDAVAVLQHGVPVRKDDVPVGAADRDEQRVLR